MSIIAFASINNATYGGVYYCANFTTSGAITWTKLTTTGLANTEITHFRVDYGDPLNKQFVMLSNDEIYYRNGGDWTKILDVAMAGVIAGGPAAAYDLSWLYTDPTTPGSVYSLFMTDPAPYQSGYCFVMKSVDYGANWSAFQFATGRSRILAVEAIGDNIWASAGKLVLATSYIYYSSNGGSSWNVQTATAGSSSTAVIRINPNEPNKAIVWGDGNAHEWTFASLTFTSRDVALGTGDGRADYVWIDPVTAGRMIYAKNGHVYSSSDYFANVTDTAISDTSVCGVIGPYNVVSNGLLYGALNPATSSVVGYLTSETDDTADERGGSNVGTPPYTDSVPGVVKLSEYGLWWGTPAAGKGVYVYADEQGDISSIPDYDNLGAPLFGDRASWRDRKTDGFDIYHAEDVERDAREIHTPQPSGNDGWGIIETSGYWVNSGEPIALDSDLHDPVTLDVDADVILDLTGQEIGLDEQNANTVFAGPATGAAAEPTFRALVSADLPATTIIIREVDTSPSVTATTLEFPNGTVTDQGGGVARYTPASVAINVHTVDTITSDTTLTSAYDVVIVDATAGDVSVNLPATSSNDGLTFFIKRIDDSANDVTVISELSTLLDSNSDPLTDSDGDLLSDSSGGASDLIDGEISQSLSQYDSLQIVADADGAEWWII